MHWKLLAAVATVATAMPALAQSPFDGTWKADVASAELSTKPESWAIRNGVYSCTTCTPAVRIPADGKVHAVPGHDYFDAMSVTVVDPTRVRYVYQRGGKTVTDSSDTINPGNATLTSEWTSTNNANGDPVSGHGIMKRVGAMPAGAHATSGNWIRTKDVQLSDKVLTLTLKMTGDSLTMTQPTGETYTARIGGPQVPLTGDPAGTTVSVRRVGKAIVETDYRRGKPVNRFTMEPMPDGRMRFTATDLKTDTTNSFFGTRS